MANNDKIEVLKTITTVVTYPALYHIIKGAIDTVVPQRTSLEQMAVRYGRIVLTLAVGSYTAKHTHVVIDKVVKLYDDNIKNK